MAPHQNPDAKSTQDTLQRTSERLVQSMARHPTMVRGLAVGLVLVVATAWGSMAISRSKAQAAGFALAHAFEIKDAVPESLRAERAEQRAKAKAAAKTTVPAAQDDGDDDDGDDARDDDGDDGDDSFSEDATTGNVPSFATPAERDEAAHQAFAKLAQSQSGPLGTLAALEALAVAEAEDGVPSGGAHIKQRNDDSLKLLAQASAAVPEQNSLAAVAALKRAQLAEDNQDTAAALAAYNQVIASQMQFLGDEARIHKARLLMAQGNIDEAADVLEDVQNNYPQTSLADELRIQMAALEEQRAKTGAPAPSHEPARASAG